MTQALPGDIWAEILERAPFSALARVSRDHMRRFRQLMARRGIIVGVGQYLAPTRRVFAHGLVRIGTTDIRLYRHGRCVERIGCHPYSDNHTYTRYDERYAFEYHYRYGTTRGIRLCSILHGLLVESDSGELAIAHSTVRAYDVPPRIECNTHLDRNPDMIPIIVAATRRGSGAKFAGFSADAAAPHRLLWWYWANIWKSPIV
jgi:hypothetical protein